MSHDRCLRPVKWLVAVLVMGFALPLWAAPRPVPKFTFCYGLERSGGLPALAQLGLNTLVIDLLPSDLVDFEPCLKLLRAAHASGFQVIIGLPTCQIGGRHVSPTDEQYVGLARETITAIVERLRNEPGVTAWSTGHYLERSLQVSDRDLRQFLRGRYADLDALNDAWGSRWPTWEQITLRESRDFDRAKPFGVGRAAIDVADCQAWAYETVMAQWLAAIRELDDRRPVLTGKVSLYRSLVSIPGGYDVVCVSMPPDVLEADIETHNVQALDMARRGGQFRVLQVLRPPAPGSDLYTSDALRDWINHAALHGSVGIALESWDMLADTVENEKRLRDRNQHCLQALRRTQQMTFDRQPQANVAIVYSPYAEGFQVTAQPVYGYIKGAVPGEPSGLIYALRYGTRYGLVDYLSPGDLTRVDLSRYATILAPAAFNMPPAAAAKLAEYVGRGGALVADLGLAVYQSGAWETLPPAWASVFGLLHLVSLKQRVGDLTVGETVSALPSVTRGMSSHGTFSPRGSTTSGLATARRLYAVGPWIAEAQLAPGAIPLANMGVRFDANRQAIFSGLIVRQSGSGFAMFATHPLYAFWPLTDPLNLALHSDLFGRRADYELATDGLLGSSVRLAYDPSGVSLLNLGRQATMAEVLAYDAHGHAYLGCVSQMTASPITQGLPAGTAHLTLRLPARELVDARRTPLIAQPLQGDCQILIQSYDPHGVIVRIAGATAPLLNKRGQPLDLGVGEPTDIRLMLGDGIYPIAAGSCHRVTITDRQGRERTQLLTAGVNGQLDLSETYRLETVRVEPAG